MYNKKSLFKNKNFFLGNNSNNKNFGTFKSRFSYNNVKDFVPGPGIYDFCDYNLKKSFNNKIHLFNTSKRFLVNKKYDFENNDDFITNMNLDKSQTEKNFVDDKIKNIKKNFLKDKIKKKPKKTKEIRPEPAQYNLESHCINYRINKKEIKKKRPIKNLRFLESTVDKEEIKKRNYKFGKEAKKKEIQDKILDEVEDFIEFTKENHLPFLSNTKRFENFEINEAKYYSKKPNWNTKSFNVNY